MVEIRKAIEKTHAARKAANIKTRQPLASITVSSSLSVPKSNLLSVLADEVNVKKIFWNQGEQLDVSLDTVVTPELKAEGEAREWVRSIQDIRKTLGTTIEDQVEVTLPDWPAAFESYIKEKVKAKSLIRGSELKVVKV
jgi:isoleucyl-tRNA synthetase